LRSDGGNTISCEECALGKSKDDMIDFELIDQQQALDYAAL